METKTLQKQIEYWTYIHQLVIKMTPDTNVALCLLDV